MQAISRIAAVAVLVAGCAHAQSQPPTRDQPPAGASPATLEHPPAPPELAPLSQDFQATMANSQLQTYRYNQLTEQALALKKLCDTGFGPADICPKGNAFAEGLQIAGSGDLPTVEEISGPKSGLRAVLVFGDGKRLTVHAGSVLSNGLVVAAITDDDVRVKDGGRESVLYFASAQAK